MKIDKTSSERLALLRFPLIVGVVFGHAYETKVNLSHGAVGVDKTSHLTDFVINLISQGAARTAVPLFFLMSGYFFFLGFSWSAERYKEKLASRTKTLLIPLLFWNAATLLLFALAQYLPATQNFFSGKSHLISTFGVYDYVNAFLGLDGMPIAYQFWFIRDLILLVLLTPAIYLIVKWAPKLFLIGILALWFFNIWPVNVPSVEAVAFFYAGAYFASSEKSLFAWDRFGVAIASAYSVVLLIDTLTKERDLNSYIHRGGVLLGVATALFLTKFIVGLNRTKMALLWAGGCSFFVFAVHEPLLTIARKVIYKIIAPSSDALVLSLYLFIPTLVILLSILLYASMKHIAPRFLSIVSGGR